MLFIALLAGIGALFNYYAVTAAIYPLIVALVLQVICFVLASLALIGYRGRRNRPSYDGAGYSIWTVRFALIVLAFIGNLSILVVLILNLLGYLSGF